ncbi:MAG: hypothetical protein H0W40_02450 [Methylibium sp.]|uniref:hypothetical protein n=1 Tax=Methylibium sp. TaxID=2067992 RepID=UPI0017C64F46|nr:hypothetical protein [Methylibium sp.]MBA3596225.1 hypothetical protein [Methylibium sp.]
MNEELDIAIEVRFRSDRGVPAELVHTITQRLARAVHDEEKDELEALFGHFQ